jgi:hypothetical protein
MLRHSDKVYVKRVRGKGRGVFARRPIAAGDVLEQVPKVLLPISVVEDDWHSPLLARFCFFQSKRQVALLMGYGSFYNHSYQPNAGYEDGPDQSVIFRALRDIAADEEICINYNGDPEDRSPVGFEVIESVTAGRRRGRSTARRVGRPGVRA